MNIDVKEFCDGCNQKYCFLAALMEHDKKYNHRLILQMKMIEIFKYKEETKQRKDIGWEGALKGWVDSNLAKKFSEIYSENLNVKEMKKKLFD